MVNPSLAVPESSSKYANKIHTNLNYWDASPQIPITINFTLPSAQQKFIETDLLERSYPVTIQDVRNNEAEYNLEAHGFQYLCDDVPELRGSDWSDQKKAIDVLIPHSERLARHMYALSSLVLSMLY